MILDVRSSHTYTAVHIPRTAYCRATKYYYNCVSTSHDIHTAQRCISSTPRAGAAARTHTGHRHRPGEATPVNRSTLRGRGASAGSPITVGSPPRSIDTTIYSTVHDPIGDALHVRSATHFSVLTGNRACSLRARSKQHSSSAPYTASIFASFQPRCTAGLSQRSRVLILRSTARYPYSRSGQVRSGFTPVTIAVGYSTVARQ